MQQDSLNLDARKMEENDTNEQLTTNNQSEANDELAQVMDQQTQRRFYWNKTTGEMRIIPPE